MQNIDFQWKKMQLPTTYSRLLKTQTYHLNVSILRNISPNNQRVCKYLQFCSGSEQFAKVYKILRPHDLFDSLKLFYNRPDHNLMENIVHVCCYFIAGILIKSERLPERFFIYLKTQNKISILMAVVIVVMLHSNKPILKDDVLANNTFYQKFHTLTVLIVLEYSDWEDACMQMFQQALYDNQIRAICHLT